MLGSSYTLCLGTIEIISHPILMPVENFVCFFGLKLLMMQNSNDFIVSINNVEAVPKMFDGSRLVPIVCVSSV